MKGDAQRNQSKKARSGVRSFREIQFFCRISWYSYKHCQRNNRPRVTHGLGWCCRRIQSQHQNQLKPILKNPLVTSKPILCISLSTWVQIGSNKPSFEDHKDNVAMMNRALKIPVFISFTMWQWQDNTIQCNTYIFLEINTMQDRWYWIWK